jgi:hypothetical protein
LLREDYLKSVMPVLKNSRREYASDPAWRASRYIGHCLMGAERGTLRITPLKLAFYKSALETKGVSGRLIEQGKKCWAR